MEIKFYVTLKIPDSQEVFSDKNLEKTYILIADSQDKLAQKLGGELCDLEIK